MQTTSVIPEAGEIVAAAKPDTDQVVHATAMHADFMVRSVFDFCQADMARRESGVPDDLAYLTRAVAMVMGVALQEQYFAAICRDHKANREEIGRALKSELENFRGFDVSALLKQIRCAEVYGKQLEVTADMHDATVGEVDIVLTGLQERVDALLQPASLGYKAGRLN